MVILALIPFGSLTIVTKFHPELWRSKMFPPMLQSKTRVDRNGPIKAQFTYNVRFAVNVDLSDWRLGFGWKIRLTGGEEELVKWHCRQLLAVAGCRFSPLSHFSLCTGKTILDILFKLETNYCHYIYNNFRRIHYNVDNKIFRQYDNANYFETHVLFLFLLRTIESRWKHHIGFN